MSKTIEDNNKEYEISRILKDKDKEFNKYLIYVFGNKIINIYIR